jgi:Zn-dependent M28 family amino/carboxypeptidase
MYGSWRKVAIVGFALAAGFARLGAWAGPPEEGAAARLVERARGSTPMLADLQELCERIGGRVTGSKACEQAVDWAAAKFRDAGVDHVVLESFPVPLLWLPEGAEASCTAPDAFPVRLAAAPGSPGTAGDSPLEARLVDVGDGGHAAFARLGAGARGAIALVHSRAMTSMDDVVGEHMRDPGLLKAAQKAQVAALLLQATRPGGVVYRHLVTLNGALAPVPAAVVAREDADRLAALARQGEVRLRLSLRNRIGGTFTSRNVVAEIRGREKPEEIVLLGAHLDSWDLGTGAQDNGVNAAMVIDVARSFRQLGLTPRRTVRFALFTGEEQGLWGSAGYVQRHRAELEKHAAVIIYDAGSGRTTGFYLNGREELRAPVEAALHAAPGLAASRHSPEVFEGTDNFAFLLAGVPNLVADQDPRPYVPIYHAKDTFDAVDQAGAQASLAVAAALTWGLADSPDRPAKVQSPAEVKNLLKATQLDEAIRALGLRDLPGGRRR